MPDLISVYSDLRTSIKELGEKDINEILGGMHGAVQVVESVSASITHTMHASFRNDFSGNKILQRHRKRKVPRILVQSALDCQDGNGR